MTQELVSQKIKKTCEGCGSVTEYELCNPTNETIEAMQQWYTVYRQLMVPTPEGPQLQKFMVQACSLACIDAAAVKLALPKMEPDQEEPIDLASLRQGDPSIN